MRILPRLTVLTTREREDRLGDAAHSALQVLRGGGYITCRHPHMPDVLVRQPRLVDGSGYTVQGFTLLLLKELYGSGFIRPSAYVHHYAVEWALAYGDNVVCLAGYRVGMQVAAVVVGFVLGVFLQVVPA